MRTTGCQHLIQSHMNKIHEQSDWYCKVWLYGNRMGIESDWKQFLSSDSTKNKNESDPIQQKNEKLNSIQFTLFQLNYGGWHQKLCAGAKIAAKPNIIRYISKCFFLTIYIIVFIKFHSFNHHFSVHFVLQKSFVHQGHFVHQGFCKLLNKNDDDRHCRTILQIHLYGFRGIHYFHSN